MFFYFEGFMQVSVEAPNKLERRITVIVPVEKLDEAYDKRILKLSKTAKIKGFRPGKVPIADIKRWYGDSARQEALSEVIQSSLYAAINQEKLNPVSTPTVEPKTVAPGEPLEFVAVFEVLPDVTAVNFALDTLEKQISTITDADIDNVLLHLRKQQAVWQKVERPAALEDQVVLDFRGSMDGVVFSGGEAHDYPIVIGSKSMIPGFEEGLIGILPNEERTINVTFPENYFSQEFAGKAAEFYIKAHSISEPVLPELNEAFVKKMGVKSGEVTDFRNEVRKNLERELARVVKAKLKNQVFDHLIQQNPQEVPKALIEREAKRIHDELHPHHAGKPHNHSEAEMATFNDAAKRNVILGLLVGFMIKQHNILPDAERIKSQIEQLSSVYENPAEVMQWYANNKRAKADVEMQVLEEQLVEKLLEKVQITEKMMSYNELISGKINT
ncbi:MAG TPA: trigger factor [Gammaproteobacteria bacterium]|jgi:trigger factor|nr:trigger factor [Gammaproteobacteria bacterium]